MQHKEYRQIIKRTQEMNDARVDLNKATKIIVDENVADSDIAKIVLSGKGNEVIQNTINHIVSNILGDLSKIL